MKLPWSNVQIDFKEVLSKHFWLLSLHKKWNFPLRISSVNVIKPELIVRKLVYRNLIYFLQQLCVSGLRYRHCEYILVKFSEPLYGRKHYWMSLPEYVFSGGEFATLWNVYDIRKGPKEASDFGSWIIQSKSFHLLR